MAWDHKTDLIVRDHRIKKLAQQVEKLMWMLEYMDEYDGLTSTDAEAAWLAR